MRSARQLWPALLCALGTLEGGCRPKEPPPEHFYEQHIQPIFNNFCTGNTSPCHRISEDGKTALGNLDLTSFDNVQKRRDLLRTYGSYPQPALLLKVMPEASVLIPYGDRLLESEIRHAGNKPIAANSDAFYELKRWLDNGANHDGVAPIPTANMGHGNCNSVVPPDDGRQAAVDTTSQAYMDFVANLQPTLYASCAFGTCHSSPQSDFYVTCGNTDDQLRFNYAQAADFVAPKGTAPEQSEILLRPLAPAGGGVSHTGGTFFQSREDGTWLTWKAWAMEVQDNPLPPLPKSTGQRFFEANVMPKLLQRGCALEGCHSPSGFNDFRLRPGAQGFIAPHALRRNYETTLTEFMALDTVDVRQSRAVKKNIFPEEGGITHRGGPLLEDMNANLSDPCPTPFDPQATNNRAICIFQEWHRLERIDHAADVSAMAAGSTLPIAVVARPPDDDNLLQFDNFRGNADLKLGTATVDATGTVTAVTLTGSALTGCAGLTPGSVDVRGPEWSYDATKLVFAARTDASTGLDLWLLDTTAGTCTRLTSDNGRQVNGVRLHNFDPVFAPDGSLVFASTRSGQLTLRNMYPNSNLYRVGPDLDFSNPQQMTFLLNSEISPAFMQDGRVTFTAEKATTGFYQLSGRRMNWDLTDYHPLLAQRAMSPDGLNGTMHASVNFEQATEIREGLDRNFMIILSDHDAKGGGGQLATFNRSIGPFEEDRTEVTFLRSVVPVDPNATGKAGTKGVYRSPFALPNGEILASYAMNVTQPASDTPHYALVAVSQIDGTRRMLASDNALSYVEAAVGYKRAERLLFKNLPQLVFGGHNDPTDASAVMHFPDVPVLATLLGSNLRLGRHVEDFDGTAALKFYEELPPPPGTAPDPTGMTVYTSRTPLGSAPLEADRSLKVRVPAQKPLIIELVDSKGAPIFTMTEEHQVSIGEYITPGPPRQLFNGICGGCHGSLSGIELDVAVTADSLTGASVSLSRDADPKTLK
jgi:hypothetical protein